jgi:hypothetical protein
VSKAKRPGRTIERRRKRDKAKPQGSPRAPVAPAAAQAATASRGLATAPSEPDRQAAVSAGELPWYARPPRKRLGALVAVAVLLAGWLCYLAWLAIVSLPHRVTPS